MEFFQIKVCQFKEVCRIKEICRIIQGRITRFDYSYILQVSMGMNLIDETETQEHLYDISAFISAVSTNGIEEYQLGYSHRCAKGGGKGGYTPLATKIWVHLCTPP